MKHFIFLMFLSLSLVACEKRSQNPDIYRTWGNTFSFKQQETVISVTDKVKSVHIYGVMEGDNNYAVNIRSLANETTAVEGIHYTWNAGRLLFSSQKKDHPIIIDIIPENITEELQITLVALDYTPITPGGYGKTVIKLIPAGAEQ